MRTKMGKSHFRRRRSRRVRALFDEMLVVEHKGTIRRVKRLAPYLKQKS